MNKTVLIIGNDKIGRKLIYNIESQGLKTAIYLDKSSNLSRLLRIFLKKRIALKHLINMAMASFTRKDFSIRQYPAICSNKDLMKLIKTEFPETIYLFRVGIIISKNIINSGVRLLNVHCADIPRYSGLAAIARAIDEQCYSQHATLCKVTENIDGGEKIKEEPYIMKKDNSYKKNEDIAYEAGIKLLLRELSDLS